MRRPELPPGVRVYAIGDIHGRLDCLEALEARIDADIRQRPVAHPVVVYLGDFVDRGPDSRGVVERLVRGLEGPVERLHLRGNHEETLLNFIDDPEVGRSWRSFGGLEALHSWGVDVREIMRGQGFDKARDAFERALPDAHLRFLAGLQSRIEIGDYCFVHAGVRPGVPLDRQSDRDLLWIRGEFLDYPGSFGKFVVHGHTPCEEPEIHANRINVDTGAYMTGRLTAVVLEGDQMDFLSNLAV